MSHLFIVRGLPGSGKTTHAQEIQVCHNITLIEPDALLVNEIEYHYTPYRYTLAKKRCLEMVTICGIMGCDVVYADVLPTIADVEQVINAYCASWSKPKIFVVDMPAISIDQSMERNAHKVRREDIERMAATWQPWPAEVTK